MFTAVGGSVTGTFALDLSSFDTSNVTTMTYMFHQCGFNTSNLSVDLSSFNTSNVTDMSFMFYGFGYNAVNLSFNLSSFNTSNVKTMESMFHFAGRNSTTVAFSIGLPSVSFTDTVKASGYSVVAAVATIEKGIIENTITNDKKAASNLCEALLVTLLIATFSPCAFKFCNLIYSSVEHAVHLQRKNKYK